jgi:predicted signal transduction protein with EAL and GGDEF domain
MVAGRVLEGIAEPLQVQHHEIAVTASIGIALYPRDAVLGERLVKSADTAMYRAKELGRNRYVFFAPEIDSLKVEESLPAARAYSMPRASSASASIQSVDSLRQLSR